MYDPNASMNVDLPTPGGPEKPTLIACPGDFISSDISS